MPIYSTNTINYDMHGRRRKRKVIRGEVYKKYKPEFKPLEPSSGPVRRDEGVVYRSLSSHGGANSTARKETSKYTGTLVKGIATMHKSNAVPIIDQEQATEIAQMRRS